MKSVNDMQREIGEWGSATFPREDKHTTMIGLSHHLRDEAEEVLHESTNIYVGEDRFEKLRMELADVGILLFQLAHEANIDLEQAIHDKMVINHAREWQAPDARGVVRHA